MKNLILGICVMIVVICVTVSCSNGDKNKAVESTTVKETVESTKTYTDGQVKYKVKKEAKNLADNYSISRSQMVTHFNGIYPNNPKGINLGIKEAEIDFQKESNERLLGLVLENELTDEEIYDEMINDGFLTEQIALSAYLLSH